MQMAEDRVLTPLDPNPNKSSSGNTSALTLVVFFTAATLLGLIVWITLAGDKNGGVPEIILALGSTKQPSPLDNPELSDGEVNLSDQLDEPLWTTPDQLSQLKDTSAKAYGLPGAIDPALIEETSIGPLPKVSADGRKPKDVYAAPFVDPDNLPKIAILVRGLGLSNKSTQAAIDLLPPQVTLSFVPYASNLQEWVDKARAKGHEVMIELPMEPYGYPDNDPGPYTLLSSTDRKENIRRLHWLLSRFSGFVGVTNYMGEKLISDKSALDEIVLELEQRGLLFLDDSASARSAVAPLANKYGLYWNKSNRMLDRASTETMDKDLAYLEAHARKNGGAIGTGFAFPVTIQTISLWSIALHEKDLRLAPISAMVDPNP